MLHWKFDFPIRLRFMNGMLVRAVIAGCTTTAAEAPDTTINLHSYHVCQVTHRRKDVLNVKCKAKAYFNAAKTIYILIL